MSKKIRICFPSLLVREGKLYPPMSTFDIDEKQLKVWKKRGAWEVDSQGYIVEDRVKVASNINESEEENVPSEMEQELSLLTVDVLKEKAKSLGLDCNHMKKGEIVKAILKEFGE